MGRPKTWIELRRLLILIEIFTEDAPEAFSLQLWCEEKRKCTVDFQVAGRVCNFLHIVG